MSDVSVHDSDEQLVAELHRLGVRHLSRSSTDTPDTPLSPSDLIAGLAQSPDARIRGALILLFLRHPEFAEEVPLLASQLSRADALTLKMHYQAAVYLQRELKPELRPMLPNWRRLPDLFAGEFGLPSASSIPPLPQSSLPALAALGKVHTRLSGREINWAGSYRQNIPRFLNLLRRDS